MNNNSKKAVILKQLLEDSSGKKVILKEFPKKKENNSPDPLLIMRQLYDKYQGIAGLESIILTQEFPFQFLNTLSKNPSITKDKKYQKAVMGLQKQLEAKEFVESLKTIMGVALAKYPLGNKTIESDFPDAQ